MKLFNRYVFGLLLLALASIGWGQDGLGLGVATSLFKGSTIVAPFSTGEFL